MDSALKQLFFQKPHRLGYISVSDLFLVQIITVLGIMMQIRNRMYSPGTDQTPALPIQKNKFESVLFFPVFLKNIRHLPNIVNAFGCHPPKTDIPAENSWMNQSVQTKPRQIHAGAEPTPPFRRQFLPAVKIFQFFNSQIQHCFLPAFIIYCNYRINLIKHKIRIS